MGFSRQEYWSGLPCPSPGNLPDRGIKPRTSALRADALSSESQGKPEYILGLMLKLKLQYFGQLMWKANSLEKTLIQGKVEGRRRKGWQRMQWLDDISNWMDMSLSKLQVMVKEREAWWAAVLGLQELDTTEQLNNNSSSKHIEYLIFCGLSWDFS